MDTILHTDLRIPEETKKGGKRVSVLHLSPLSLLAYFLFKARSTFTAHATVQPTIGLFPIPRNPIIST